MKKKTIQDFYAKLQEEKQRLKDLNRIAFEFYDSDRDGALSVLDMLRLQTAFDDSSAIAREISAIMEVYENHNVRPKYVKEPLVINFERFHQMNEQSCLVGELQYLLVDS